MQTEPLVNKITTLLNELKSGEIMEFLSQPNLNKVDLLTLIIESKIGYEKWRSDSECSNIIEEIEEHHIYDDTNYNKLLNYISNLGSLSQNSEADLKLLLWFRHFHTMIIKTCNVVIKLMNNHQPPPVATQANIISNPLPEQAKIISKTRVKTLEIISKEINTKNNEIQDVKPNSVLKQHPPADLKEVNNKINPDGDEDDLNLNSFLKSISLV